MASTCGALRLKWRGTTSCGFLSNAVAVVIAPFCSISTMLKPGPGPMHPLIVNSAGGDRKRQAFIDFRTPERARDRLVACLTCSIATAEGFPALAGLPV